MCLNLEAPVATAVEEQRLALGRIAELEDTPHHDDVIAGVVLRDRLAVDERERGLENRRTAATVRVRHVRKAVGAFFGEEPADLLAVLGEDVRGPLSTRLDARPRRRRLRRAEQDQLRVE